MRGLTHPYSGAKYDNTEDGRILITNTNGDVGFFSTDGLWLSGAVRECDRVFAMWVAGEQLVHHKLGDVKADR